MATFNPRDHVLSIGGSPISGLAKQADAISISYAEDHVKTVSGCDGKAMFVETNDRTAVGTVKLLPNSMSNDVLSALAASGAEVTLSLTDVRGTVVGSASQCRIMKRPDATAGSDLPSREWKFAIADWEVAFAGSV